MKGKMTAHNAQRLGVRFVELNESAIRVVETVIEECEKNGYEEAEQETLRGMLLAYMTYKAEA